MQASELFAEYIPLLEKAKSVVQQFEEFRRNTRTRIIAAEWESLGLKIRRMYDFANRNNLKTISGARSHRGLMDVLGSIGKTLFGIATEQDISSIHGGRPR
jgi:hypothetical protein